MTNTVVKKYGIGFQIIRFHYRNEKENIGFKSACAPVTIGYRKGKFTFRIKKSKVGKIAPLKENKS